MRYQIAAGLDFESYFTKIINAKHSVTRLLLRTARPRVVERCQEYMAALTSLDPLLPIDWPKPTQIALEACYGKTIPLSELKEAILGALRAQSEINLVRCACCMLNEPQTWDHYLPKSKYPEYSVFHKNLVYICFGCNHRKSDDSDDDELIYCHPYYTVHRTEVLLHCNAGVRNGSLVLRYYCANENQPVAADIAQRHLELLDLDRRFQLEAGSLVASLIGELRLTFPHGVSEELLRTILRGRYNFSRENLGSNAWDSRLWHGLSSCPQFLEYVNEKIRSVIAPHEDGFEVPAPPPPII